MSEDKGCVSILAILMQRQEEHKLNEEDSKRHVEILVQYHNVNEGKNNCCIRFNSSELDNYQVTVILIQLPTS